MAARGSRLRILTLLLASANLLLSPVAAAGESSAAELKAAQALFRANLDAIQRHDQKAYLACYLDSPELAVTGPSGPVLGYGELQKSVEKGWPDVFDASDLHLVAVRPGVVYGTYRFRVRYGSQEESGLSERLFVRTPKGWKIAVTTAFLAPPPTPPPPRAFVGATLLDGTGASAIANAVILVRDGKIECAGRECTVPKGVETTELRGLWITPGLVDAHVHFSQTGWADGRPDSIDVRERYPYERVEADLERNPDRFFRSQLCAGVTAVFDVGGYPWTIGMAKRAPEIPWAPHVAAAGPLLSTIDFWLNLPAQRQFIYLKDPEAARAGVRYLAAEHADAVKIWYIVTPERSVEDSAPSVLAAGDEAKKLGLPLIVHATGLAEAKVALQAGAHLLVHGVGDLPVDEEFLSLAKKNHTVYCPTLTVFSGYLRMNQSVLAKTRLQADDPNGCVDRSTLSKIAETADLPAPERLNAERVAALAKRVEDVDHVGRANLKRVADAGIPIAMGTDAGNPLTLHGPSVYAEMEAMQAAGLSPMQVLVASTRGGSLAMGRQIEIGTVEKGKAADLLIVAADPTADIANLRRVRFVVRGGVLRSIEELSAAVDAAGRNPAR